MIDRYRVATKIISWGECFVISKPLYMTWERIEIGKYWQNAWQIRKSWNVVGFILESWSNKCWIVWCENRSSTTFHPRQLFGLRCERTDLVNSAMVAYRADPVKYLQLVLGDYRTNPVNFHQILKGTINRSNPVFPKSVRNKRKPIVRIDIINHKYRIPNCELRTNDLSVIDTGSFWENNEAVDRRVTRMKDTI
jgi:hypothetical protein